MEVAVVGATGFLGQAITSALTAAGHTVRPLRAPRLLEPSHRVAEIAVHASAAPELRSLQQGLDGCQGVVNAAGCADPRTADWAAVAGANSLLPALVALAAAAAGVRRMVHLSSTAVQGRAVRLDESATYESFSPYSESKQLGEQVLLAQRLGTPRVVILRPGSVHGAGRATTGTLRRFARSRLSSVAGRGDQPSPQNLVQNVARAVAFLLQADDPPPIVLQPWEGVTAAGVLRRLGDKEPLHLPIPLARAALVPIRAAGALSPTAQAWSRRLELVWFGQRQTDGYLDRTGYRSQYSDAMWLSLAEAV